MQLEFARRGSGGIEAGQKRICGEVARLAFLHGIPGEAGAHREVAIATFATDGA